MKRCPKCLKEYGDDSLNFCLEDGAWLADNSGPSESSTQIFDSDKAISLGNRRDFVNSIGVMPLADWSSEPDQQYFCDGLVEDIINSLTKIDELKVASCTSSFYFKGKKVTAAEFGRALGVENILDGSVRRVGDRLRVTIQLVSVADGVQIWSEQYDRTMGDMFAVQDELTRTVVETVRPILLNPQK